MSAIQHILKNFGLSENEIEIYLAALSLERPSAADIARKLDKQRTAVYFHMKNLLDKGLLRKTQKGKLIRFLPLPPSELAATFERWITDFKSFVPQLEKIRTIDEETPLISVTESHKGYYQIYDELSSLPQKSVFRVIEGKTAMTQELHLLTDQEVGTFFRRVVERGIETRAIFTEESLKIFQSETSKENYELLSQKRIWHLRTLPEEMLPLRQVAFVYGTKVAVLFPEPSLVITIQHRGMAEVFRVIFEALFQFAQPNRL
ncbi:MAG: hypothetical protein A3B74_04695 [Candidatus Kerfeldbacteria bacterium RIFCSPHIGHO2_02_FULL_42_14]|uniref:Transcription regulator TrmB N-terminal domain-containing protein n=1 Tax=Candidatus Kerfeldbacteria bacterium RIFCSPHIGHO2_02_FULL_42_14 TaxID=1798540 RepID=A0A1G2AQ72_9BACT|nr:MAG: hypothetical protein A3B74_04695 [Candidatus Kerfeldbacteria bacterium RIFCSPHIGHO2_02_FULL_42_14]OGY81023.1 MAG: hypothetical protein A3E60_03415 [Candidatus Kerfeldbacteria bacterium RIFCSPHIGHO2_12_FULL_42_13]OGY84943.1 MAG: hypothetical protein A3I91_00460 [Candidatus Kerfeldbacteria bacterium RIFCSPLOWO2_02_FULL_42_19]OGY85644.1 MAG: hypothetical protein A3G01_04700 [Candidatus Kerfeldbacteria bacterium RIFCSPLOWO2_12_FULL_43_9]